MRVRGPSASPTLNDFAEAAPHPTLSSQERGEGVDRPRSETQTQSVGGSETATSMVRLSAVAIKMADKPIITCPFELSLGHVFSLPYDMQV